MRLLIPLDGQRSQHPELFFAAAAAALQNVAHMPEYAIKNIDEYSQYFVVFRHAYLKSRNMRRNVEVLIQNGAFFGDILHDAALRHITVVHHHDEVLAMRHEHQLISIETMHHGNQESVEIAA